MGEKNKEGRASIDLPLWKVSVQAHSMTSMNAPGLKMICQIRDCQYQETSGNITPRLPPSSRPDPTCSPTFSSLRSRPTEQASSPS